MSNKNEKNEKKEEYEETLNKNLIESNKSGV